MTVDLKMQCPAVIPVTEAALLLDLDGTLVGFQDHPDTVTASDDVLSLLAEAQDRLEGRLAVLSGRSIASVDTVLHSSVASVAGVHGLQQRIAGVDLLMTPAHPAIAVVAETMDVLAAAAPGLVVERKGQSAALHYRRTPGAADAVVECVDRLAKAYGLEVQQGHMVAELRTPGPDKGDAVTRFMESEAFRQARPIFIGDDLTDEAGFMAAATHGGAGVLVGPDRPTAAQGRLDNPTTVRRWIKDCLSDGVFDLAAAGVRVE